MRQHTITVKALLQSAAMIKLTQAAFSRGGHNLFSAVDLTIHAGEHIGVTGANGCGKSSLFGILAGRFATDSGEVSLPADWRISEMRQETPHCDRSALEYVLDGHVELRRLEALQRQVETGGDGNALAVVLAQLDAIDAHKAPAEARKLLAGLGFAVTDHERPVNHFSGGWRIRLNLAQALMCPADLMLLDEPTNHLDLDTVTWLEAWLQRFPGTLLVISHDREFLDAVSQRTILFEGGGLVSYRGNYSAAELQRGERLARQQAMYERQQQRIAEMEAFVRRFRAKATKARQAQSRLKALERLERIEAAHVDSPFHFTIQCHAQQSDPLLALRDACFGYDDRRVLSAVSLNIHPGDRIGVLGANGAGKSTLMRGVAGLQAPLSGERVAGANLVVGYFAQQQLETLDPEASPLLHLRRLAPDAREQQLRDFLGAFAFDKAKAEATIAQFSGGEKARLALALLAWHRPNLMILDEPTNHLDLDMRQALTVALQAFDGAVLVVSHDRHLLKNSVDQLVKVADGRVTDYPGTLEDYQREILAGGPAPSRSAEPGPATNRRQQRQLDAERRRALQPLRKRVAELEQGSEKLARQLADIELQLGDAALYEPQRGEELTELLRHQGQLRQQQEQLEQEWLAALEELESAAADEAEG